MDDDKIDLRGGSGFEGKSLFKVDHISSDNNVGVDFKKDEDATAVFDSATNKIKIKFEKFVNLVATHAYEDLFAKYKDEDVVVSADLLTDLANAHGDKEEKSISLIFVFGAIIGAILVWFLFK